MDVGSLQSEFTKLVHQHNLLEWKLFVVRRLDKRHKIIAECVHSTHTIFMAEWFIKLNTKVWIFEVLKHEVAHAIAGYKAKHKKEWKMACKNVGCLAIVNYPSSIIKRPRSVYRGNKTFSRLPDTNIERLPANLNSSSNPPTLASHKMSESPNGEAKRPTNVRSRTTKVPTSTDRRSSRNGRSVNRRGLDSR